MAVLYEFIIKGDPRTKKNSSRAYGRKLLPSAAFMKYRESALPQLASQTMPPVPIGRPVTVCGKFYMQTRRKVDLGNLMNATLDILRDAQILVDDDCLNVPSYDGSRVYWDKNNPRAEIYIMPFDEDPPWERGDVKWNKEKRTLPGKTLRCGGTEKTVCKPTRRKRTSPKA